MTHRFYIFYAWTIIMHQTGQLCATYVLCVLVQSKYSCNNCYELEKYYQYLNTYTTVFSLGCGNPIENRT